MELVLSINFEQLNINAIDDIFMVFHNGPISIKFLTENDVGSLLTKLTNLRTIDNYWIRNFISSASLREVELTACFFINRAEYIKGKLEVNDCGYHLYGISLGDKAGVFFRKSPKCFDLMNNVKMWVKKSSDAECCRDLRGKLFSIMFAPFDDEVVGFLQDWLNEGEGEDYKLIADIVGQASRDFVFQQKKFVINFLEFGALQGIETLRYLEGSLFESVIRGVKYGVAGQPFSEDLIMVKEAEKVLDEVSLYSPAHDFYERIKKYAEFSIQVNNEDAALFEESLFVN
jgi:hypothetical protein